MWYSSSTECGPACGQTPWSTWNGRWGSASARKTVASRTHQLPEHSFGVHVGEAPVVQQRKLQVYEHA
eukprot:8882624-Alexandrium_andersonii.AAC.1